MDPEVGALAPMFSLGAGEVAALTLSRRRPSLIFLTDDMAARLAAVQLGVRAHGTLGVLLRSVRRGDIPKQEMMALLRSLPGRSSLYLRNDLLEEVVRELDGWRPDDGQ